MTDHHTLHPLGPVVSAQWLQQRMCVEASHHPLVIIDCSFDLAQPDAGPLQYASAHIEGADYAHLEHDLSANDPAVNAASGGRHPLPSREDFSKTITAWGIGPTTTVVVYDRNANMFCGRLWWMLKWCGHDQVYVLDGGWNAWLAAQGPIASGHNGPVDRANKPIGAPFQLQEPLVRLHTVDDVMRQLGSPEQFIVDARSTPRFTGEVEPIDPRAGHIPGAVNRPFSNNFTPDGLYKPAATLQTEWAQVLDGRDPATVVMQCGSGVTAVANMIAMVVAGYEAPALFAGSWSEWCRDPNRPVAMGD